MATSYTTLLGLALPVNGELDGTWGDTVNNSITELVEDAVAGTATASVTGGDWTLSTTGSGAVNEARCAILIPTGSPGVTRNIIAPAKSKAYVVVNQSNAAVVIKSASSTGVSLASGVTRVIAWDGSDFALAGVAIGGTDTQVQYNSGGYFAGSANLTFNGTTLAAAAFSGPINGAVGGAAPNTVAATTITATTSVAAPINKAISGGYVEFYESTNTYKAAVKASNLMGASYTLTLPINDGDTGQVLTTDGSGVLSWATPASGVSTAGNNTWTGTQTFTNSLMRLLGSSTGATTFTSANSSATNYTVTIPAENMTVGFKNIPSVGAAKTGSYSLATADNSKFVTIGASGAITIPNSVFAEGDIVMLYNSNATSVSVTCAITTAYLAGTTTDVGSFTLLANGIATIFFVSGSTCIISGNAS